ncbi:hypothetical protein [Schlesneria paludicola]|uniref:hypothetical protein n=1 Tax=Schlesneria paludicola TaxID=360056 RepID=UPI00029A46E4|nr:hypothetical protein [Schlesneria paludicola]
MNTSASNSDSRRVRYLTRALCLNPVFQAGEIVELRNKYLGLKALPSASQMDGDSEEFEERRAAAARIIERVREHFWQMPLDSLRSKLAGLKLKAFPDLKHAATRLSITAASRDTFPDLVRHKDFDSSLFTALKTVLVSSPRDVVSVKEKFRKRLRDRQNRGQAIRMVRLLKSRVPDVYELEQDWLESITHYRPPKSTKSKVAKSAGGQTWSGFEFSFEGFGWIGWVAIVIGLRLLRYAMSQS